MSAPESSPALPSDPELLWASLSLSAESLSKTPSDLPSALLPPSSTDPPPSDADWDAVISASLRAYENENSQLSFLSTFESTHLVALEEAEAKLVSLADRLSVAEQTAISLQDTAASHAATAASHDAMRAHLSAFIDQVVIDPHLIRHVVDGKVGEEKYSTCLNELSKKVALYDMQHVRATTVYKELSPCLGDLVSTAVTKVRNFLADKLEFLKRPNTNVNIVKESVLLRHRPLVAFIEQHAPTVFRELRSSYVDTMSRTYYVLFRKYTAGLLEMKQLLPSGRVDTLVGSLEEDASSFALFGTRTKPGSGGAGVGQFALGERLQVLRDVEGPAIVLATAQDNGERFYYEQIHRSLGKMLSETCASEHLFCEEFFGESNGRMFNSFFTRIVGFLLEAVAAHTAPTRDAIGVLLALKVNEAQRSLMQMRKIMDLSDFFIQVDILLKPKFKKLLDENVASMVAAGRAIGKTGHKGDGDTGAHIVTRRFGEFSASVLAIARFGTRDDSVMEGLRRLRAEYNGFLNVCSTLFTRPKARYVFLVNNVDLILAMMQRHGLHGTAEFEQFRETQEVHTAAYVEHEVADHFPDVVSFVRQFERTKKAAGGAVKARAFPGMERVIAVLKQFAANWKLGMKHLQDCVLREFPNFELGCELLKKLFSRLLGYHARCEAAVRAEYAVLLAEVVAKEDIIYEMRRLDAYVLT